jgi:hypothetical protein
MRIIYFTILGLLTAAPMSAQIVKEWLPYYPEVERKAQAEETLLEQELSLFQGRDFQVGEKSGNCPELDPFSQYIFSGDSLIITVDTTGFGGGVNSTLELVNCDPIDFASVQLDSTDLKIFGNVGVDIGLDTVCVEFCKDGTDCELFTYPIVIKRRGTTYVDSKVTVEANTLLPEYCVDESVLPGELFCNRFLDCPDDYDGEGRQVIFFTTYSEPTSCIAYQSSRFAGVDTVCLVLCDEFTVCDTFKIPFEVQSDTLSLPFFDDFAYDGPYPSIDNWLDRDGFVNSTLAKDPPSVGLLTMDGINRRGRPYSNNGKADQLTSRYLDLSSTNGDVYIKFFVAPKGYGLPPNNEGDTLVLQFRDNQRNWETVQVFDPILDIIPSDSVPPFQYYSVPVSGSEYLYDGFQFRFISYNNQPGILDIWHLDYVWLSDQADDDDTFSDIAFTSQPPFLLKNYTSMPWRHFEGFVDEEFNDEDLASGFYNHFTQTQAITDSEIRVRERLTNTDFPGNDNVVNGTDANIPPKEAANRLTSLEGTTIGDYKAILENNFPGEERVELELSYSFNFDAQQNLFLRNDTVRRVTYFDNYFAYDDGTAESFIFLRNPQGFNPTLAMRYPINVDDTLRAIQFHHPHLNWNAESQLYNLYVWLDDLESDPVYEALFQNPLYADSKFDTLQGFTTVVLKDILGELTPVALPAGTELYIGFQQLTQTEEGIPIGFDINNDASANTFLNLVGDWIDLPPDIVGSVMMRPVVGDETPVATTTKEVVSFEETSYFRVFPNPSFGYLELEELAGTDQTSWTYQLLNQLGQVVQAGPVSNRLDLSNEQAGVYFLRLQQQGAKGQQVEKIIVVK